MATTAPTRSLSSLAVIRGFHVTLPLLALWLAVARPTTHALIRHLAEVCPLGRLELKGKEEPVEAYELVALREEPRVVIDLEEREERTWPSR